MRHLFLVFLAFLVVLPSLVCAMPVCSMSHPADVSIPCHGQMDDDQIDLDEPMLLQDCMGVDFQVAEKVPGFGMGDKVKDTFDSVPAIVNTNYRSILAFQGSPRAPPFRWSPFLVEPSIIITTQRFRI